MKRKQKLVLIFLCEKKAAIWKEEEEERVAKDGEGGGGRDKNEMREFSNFQIRSSIDFNLISLFLSLVQA